MSSHDRPSWSVWALKVAAAVATRADCTRRKVGAVILDPHNRIVGTGYNGAPSGRPGCLTAGACPRGRANTATPGVGYDTEGDGFCTAIHAEVNAIINSTRDLRGCRMFVTEEPCAGCLKVITGAGLATVTWMSGTFMGPRLVDLQTGGTNA